MEPLTDITFENSETVGKLVSPEEVARNLEIYYRDRELLTYMQKQAQEKFLRPEYQWKTIAHRWGEIFERVCS
jgi:hypothetical protein